MGGLSAGCQFMLPLPLSTFCLSLLSFCARRQALAQCIEQAMAMPCVSTCRSRGWQQRQLLCTKVSLKPSCAFKVHTHSQPCLYPAVATCLDQLAGVPFGHVLCTALHSSASHNAYLSGLSGAEPVQTPAPLIRTFLMQSACLRLWHATHALPHGPMSNKTRRRPTVHGL